MTNYQITNPDCEYYEKRQMDVGCSAMMEGGMSRAVKEGKFGLVERGGRTLQAYSLIGKMRYI